MAEHRSGAGGEPESSRGHRAQLQQRFSLRPDVWTEQTAGELFKARRHEGERPVGVCNSMEKNGLTPDPQRRVLRLWLAAQRRRGSLEADDTEEKLRELCAADGRDPDGSDEEEEEEEMDNSEPLEDSDVILSDSGERSQAVPLNSAEGSTDSNFQLFVCLFFTSHR